MTIIDIITAAITELEARKDRSTWDKAVTADAIDLLDYVTDAANRGEITADNITSAAALDEAMLNGARDWKHYSWSGCALCYDGDIANHYCTPSELRRTANGNRRPNAHEEWLDVQARALYQAAARARKAIRKSAISA